MFHEYPKALYRNGEYSAVSDFDAEQAQRAEGWTDWHSDQERMTSPAEPETAPSEPDSGRIHAESAELVDKAPEPVRNKGGRPRKVQ